MEKGIAIAGMWIGIGLLSFNGMDAIGVGVWGTALIFGVGWIVDTIHLALVSG